jgi:DNA-binding transcriptional regulator/RsmH inhibitor MraZ
MVFTNAYPRTIDVKNRVQIPAELRALQQGGSDGDASAGKGAEGAKGSSSRRAGPGSGKVKGSGRGGRPREVFYLVPGYERNTLALVPEKQFEADAARIATEQIEGDDAIAFEELYYSLASRLEVDGQGRVLLPERHLKMVDVGKEVTLAGSKTRITIWRTADYEEFVQTNFEQDRWRKLQQFLRRPGGAQSGRE